MSIQNMLLAKKKKNNEFYTRLCDIEKELVHYDFAGKVVYCNCDDPTFSQFWIYFESNFEKLKLKKLIATHLNVSDNASYKIEKTNEGTLKTIITGDGDFRSAECVELLKESDIVVTNPPFSLFREFITLLVTHDKQFLVVGSVNAITYNCVSEQMLNKKIYLGNSWVPYFYLPDGTLRNLGFVCWFTNIQKNKHELILTKPFDATFKKYDDIDAIEVGKVKDIPADYYEAMRCTHNLFF